LFGGAVLLAEKRPTLAGILFGSLIFKPHLALLVPVALAVRGMWRAFFAAGATASALIALSLAVLGADTWRGFFAVSPLARKALEDELVGSEKMQSVFAAIRLLHGSVLAGYAAQAAVALAACVMLVLLARRGASARAQGAALAAATLIATPFLLDYDLTLLAIPLAWLFDAGRRRGFLAWEKITLFAAFVLPLVSRLVAARTGIPLGPLVLALLFAVLLRRGFREGRGYPDRVPPMAAPALS
jgi:hypothetical protein